MSYGEFNNISYEKSGPESCILDGTVGKIGNSIRIPEMIEGLKVVGFNAKFIESLSEVEYIHLSSHVSQVGFIGNHLGEYLKDSHLSEIEVDPDNPYFKSVDGVLFSRDGRTLVFYPPAKEESKYRIPDGVEYISKYAFIHADNLKTLTLGVDVKSLREFTLYSCQGLISIDILGRDTVLNGNPFQSCSKVSRIEFPNGSSIYQVRNGVLYTEFTPGKYILWLFPPAMKLKHYVVSCDACSISYSAMYFLMKIDKVHIPKRCKLPFKVNGLSLSFYDPVRPPAVEAYYDSSPLDDSSDVALAEKKEEVPVTYKTAIERIFEEFVVEHTLSIPTYKVYLRIKGVLSHHLSMGDSLLLESIYTICLPSDMKTVNMDFFNNFINLGELICNGTGIVQVVDNVLYEKGCVVYYPPCCKSKTLIIKKAQLHIGDRAFAYNKNLENLVLDSTSITIGSEVFEYAQVLSNVIFSGVLNDVGRKVFSGCKSDITLFAYGKFNGCNPAAFTGLKGSIDILVLRMTEKCHLQKILKKGPYIIKLITPQEMDKILRSGTSRYEMDPSCLPFVGKKSGDPIVAKVERLPRNARVEIRVMGHRFACMNNHHHLETKKVSVDMIDSNCNYRTVDLNVGYCRECRNYFVYSNVFMDVRDKIEYSKWKLIGVNFYEPCGRSYGYILESVGELRKESILKICGYSVGQSSDLSAVQRMNILTGIIKRNWLTKQGVMSYLNWFIDFHGHNPSMAWAVRDWKYDLRALQNMTI